MYEAAASLSHAQANLRALAHPSASPANPCQHTPDVLLHALPLFRPCFCSIRARFEKVIRDAQDSICAAISEIDGKPFHQDAWTREDGGGGITRVLAVSTELLLSCLGCQLVDWLTVICWLLSCCAMLCLHCLLFSLPYDLQCTVVSQLAATGHPCAGLVAVLYPSCLQRMPQLFLSAMLPAGAHRKKRRTR